MMRDAIFDSGDEVLRGLRVFLSVARSGSIARSAEQIYKAPSAITRALALLEQALGQTLFERKPRGMLLNAYGEAVFKRAVRIDEEMQAAAEALCVRRGHVADAASLKQLLLSGHKLRIFVALAEHAQIGVVSEHLHLSKSGVSMSLARLEEALEQPLFQRMAQGMVTTDAASKLLVRAKRAFSELRQLPADLSALQGTLHGTIAIGALPLGRTRLLPTAIARLLRKYPALKIQTLESPYDELAKGLRCGDIDLIFGALRTKEIAQDFESEVLFEDKVLIFSRKDHPLALAGREVLDDHPLSIEQLARASWILPRQDSPGRQVLNQVFVSHHLAIPAPSVETGDLAILRNLLINTDLITAMSPHQLHYEIESGQVVQLPVSMAGTERDIGITQRRGVLPSPAVTAILNEIRLIVREPL